MTNCSFEFPPSVCVIIIANRHPQSWTWKQNCPLSIGNAFARVQRCWSKLPFPARRVENGTDVLKLPIGIFVLSNEWWSLQLKGQYLCRWIMIEQNIKYTASDIESHATNAVENDETAEDLHYINSTSFLTKFFFEWDSSFFDPAPPLHKATLITLNSSFSFSNAFVGLIQINQSLS